MTAFAGSGADLELVRRNAAVSIDDRIHLARWGRTLCNASTGLHWHRVTGRVNVTCPRCCQLDPRTPTDAA